MLGVHNSSSNSLPITPAVEPLNASAAVARPASATPNESHTATEEVLRLKLELAQAQNKISRLDQELAQRRLVQQYSGRVTPAGAPGSDFLPSLGESGAPRINGISIPNPMGRAPFPQDQGWSAQDDCHSDTSNAFSAGGFNRSRTIWGNGKPRFQNSFLQGSMNDDFPGPDGLQSVPWAGRSSTPDLVTPVPGPGPFAPSTLDGYRSDRRTPEQDMMMRPPGNRRGGRYDNRYGSLRSFNAGYGCYSAGDGHFDVPSGFAGDPPGPLSGPIGGALFPPHHQQQTGASLSPHATEFTSNSSPVCTGHGDLG